MCRRSGCSAPSGHHRRAHRYCWWGPSSHDQGERGSLLAWAESKRRTQVRPNTVTEHGHGRQVTPTTKVLQVTADEAGFPHVTQLVQVHRTRIVHPARGTGRKPRNSVEVIYLPVFPRLWGRTTQALAGWAQSHRAIENALHWMRDVTFGDDASRVRTGAGPRVMATLHPTVISVLRHSGSMDGIQGAHHCGSQPPTNDFDEALGSGKLSTHSERRRAASMSIHRLS